MASWSFATRSVDLGDLAACAFCLKEKSKTEFGGLGDDLTPEQRAAVEAAMGVAGGAGGAAFGLPGAVIGSAAAGAATEGEVETAGGSGAGGFFSSLLGGAKQEAGALAKGAADAGITRAICAINPNDARCFPGGVKPTGAAKSFFSQIPVVAWVGGGIVLLLLLRRKSAPSPARVSNPRRRRHR